MNFSKSKELPSKEKELPLTTMIDVVFLLLVFFMVTTTISKPESQLPSALQVDRKGSAALDLQPQILWIERRDDRAAFRIGQQIVADPVVLTQILAQLPKDAGVFVRGSSDVTVDSIAAGLQACSNAGFTKVSYVPVR